jgi:TRAP-type C4-dicarboxylate transport system permease small subunit
MSILPVLAGAIIMGYLIAALLFLRLWRRVSDRLFLFFSGAFALMALNQGILAVGEIPHEERSWVYLIRLLAFSLIILAILLKNTESRRGDDR